MARRVAVVVSPPSQAATSNLGQAELEGDIRSRSCEKRAVGISHRLRDNTHILGNAQACFFRVDVSRQPQQLLSISQSVCSSWLQIGDCC